MSIVTFLRTIGAAVLVAHLVACAGGPTVQLSSADRHRLEAVTMEANPQIPADIYIDEPEKVSASLLGGAVGALLITTFGDDRKGRLVAAMASNGIDLPRS
jgi:hypothetical protein